MHVCTCIYIVCVCSCEFMCLVACYSISDSFVRDLSSVTGNFDYVRYESDTQAIRIPTHGDDPEIRTGSCSEDQTKIRIRNRVISCECLLLYHFLIYFYQ